MSTLTQAMPVVVDRGISDVEAQTELMPANAVAGHAQSIAEEQIQRLVWQLFFQGSNQDARQVLFCGVEDQSEIAALCMKVGEAVGAVASGATCVVEALTSCSADHDRETNVLPSHPQASSHTLRNVSEQLSGGLWFMNRGGFLNGSGPRWSHTWLRHRLATLRLEFDYTILQGPAGWHDEAALLGSLCDGVVLVLRANHTRRLVAQNIAEKLHDAHARLLGAVLTESTFPVPEAIYRRL